MNFQFEILFTISLRHAYFEDGVFRACNAVATADTREIMKRYGMGYKVLPGKIQVFYDTRFAGSNRSRASLLKEGLVLGFELQVTDAHFLAYTSLPYYQPSVTAMYFSNTDFDNADSPYGTLLHAGEAVTVANIVCPVANPGKPQPISPVPHGIIDMALTETLEEQFCIAFTPGTAYWQYILLSDHLKELHNPSVIHKDTREAFKGPARVMMPDGKEGIAFISGEAMVYSQKPSKFFQLVEEYDAQQDKGKVVIPMLPNPDVKHITGIRSPFEIEEGVGCACVVL